MNRPFVFRRLAQKVGSRRYQSSFPYTPASNRLRAIFIHIPKAAGTSVRYALGEPAMGRRHLPWWVYKEADYKKFNSYFKFAFVRDPWDRVMSGFEYLKAGGNQAEDLAVAEALQEFETFEDFVRLGLVDGYMLYHPVFRPQSWYLSDWAGNLMVDFLGRYESLDKDFSVVAEHLGISASLPVLNKVRDTVTSGVPERRGSQALKTIAELYADDYCLLDYPGLGQLHCSDLAPSQW